MAGQTRIDGNLIDTGTDPNDIVSVSVGDARYPRLSEDNTLAGNLTVDGQVRSDNVTDSAGTGAPAFPNGMSVTGAALTDPEITGGIYLGGTGSANYLDDYEEGTFTLTLGIVFSGSANFTNTVPGRYVKVGKVVNCEFRIISLNGSNSISVNDRFELTGLPFTPQTSQVGHGMGSIHLEYGGGRSSHWNIRADSNNAALMWCFHEDGAVDYGNVLQGSITYEVA